MNTTTRMALIELKEWCQRYHAVIENRYGHTDLVQITFGTGLEDIERVYARDFSEELAIVIREERETI